MNEDKLKDELDRALKEIIRLSDENERLAKIVSNVGEDIKRANNMTENYKQMFDALFNLIVTTYDSEFRVECIPRFLS